MQEKNKSYIAIITAAGLSERMGSFKPLLDLGGKPALLQLIDSIAASGFETIIIVTGYRQESIREALGGYPPSCANYAKDGAENTIYRLFTINNEFYKTGMFSSVKAGIGKVNDMLKNADLHADKHKATLLFLADVPLVSAETIRGLIQKWEDTGADPEAFAVPVYEGRNGHPLLIPKGRYDEILDYAGAGGLKAIRNRYGDSMIRYETNDAGCVLDMDTKDDYATLAEYLKTKRTLRKSK